MDELGRKLVYNESLVEKTKIFRNESITCIEDLSNEIFYEILDYFDGGEIVITFFNLDSRFEQLLYSSPLLIKTHFYLFHYQEMMNTFNELDILSTKICSNLKILFLRTIFKKINHYDNHQLRSLCFHVQTSDDRIVEDIKEMIKCEKLLHYFTVKRILDTVYLQWK